MGTGCVELPALSIVVKLIMFTLTHTTYCIHRHTKNNLCDAVNIGFTIELKCKKTVYEKWQAYKYLIQNAGFCTFRNWYRWCLTSILGKW
jgi:hypothetical protein